MKKDRLFFLFILLAVFASCQIHQNNFSKRKFLDLKKMDGKELVTLNNQEDIGFAQMSINACLDEEFEPTENISSFKSENKPSKDVEITGDEIEISNNIQSTISEETEYIIHSEQIDKPKVLVSVPKEKKPKSTDQLFKIASLIFLLGLLLILVALVGLFKATISEPAGFVFFFLGLISLIVSSINAILGSIQMNNEKSRKRNTQRRDFVVFFGIFFIVLSLMMIHGNV